MKILVFNAGSSSYKCSLYDFQSGATAQQPLWEGMVEFDHHHRVRPGDETVQKLLQGASQHIQSPSDIAIVAHRVVHGGDRFTKPVLVDAGVKKAIRELIHLAPLHNPANLEGIEIMERLFPKAGQVAVFDTAFHSRMPPEASTYAIPSSWRQMGIHRYGFHGISHEYCSHRASGMLNKPIGELKIISCHLGNGSSLAAIHHGISIDTTMGFTPLEGMVMGSRCGSIDPGILLHLLRTKKVSVEMLERSLNEESGLMGLCGYSDMRKIMEVMEQNPQAHLAYNIYLHSLARNIGAMLGSLGGLDLMIFTGGIGENVPSLRESIADRFSFLGMDLDSNANKSGKGDRDISGPKARVRTLVIHTKEAFTIALAAFKLGTIHGAAH